MDEDQLRRLFPTLEEPLFEELVKHGTVKEVKAGETLLKVGQTIRSTMLILDGLVKLYREDDEGKEFFIYHLDAGQACSLSMVCATKHERSEVREDLAKQMYHSLRDKLMPLNDDVLVYPAHGAGTLCGKNLSKESSSTIGAEKKTNWSLQPAIEEEFVKNLLADQPFVPAYFPFDVELNRKGAAPMKQSIAAVKVGDAPTTLDTSLWVVDVRAEADFKEGHLPHSINLMESGKLETWLGSIIKPEEQFYIAAESKTQLQTAIERAAAIGYETAIKEAFVINGGLVKEAELDVDMFRNNTGAYTIIDVRNPSEVAAKTIFPNSLSIPLLEIRERVAEIPTDKPIVIHCAGGYRSAAASSLVHAQLNGSVNVFDLGEAVKQF